ncbi:MAG: ATP-binding cassette domain-containing protein, partial [Gammaproteobacteria bacterium]
MSAPHLATTPAMDTETLNSPALLSAVSISKSFGDRQILSKVNLEIRSSQVVTLIGPNGAGKTTLVRILLNLLQPETGSIKRQNGLRIGYMPQHMQVDTTMPLTV